MALPADGVRNQLVTTAAHRLNPSSLDDLPGVENHPRASSGVGSPVLPALYREQVQSRDNGSNLPRGRDRVENGSRAERCQPANGATRQKWGTGNRRGQNKGIPLCSMQRVGHITGPTVWMRTDHRTIGRNRSASFADP